MGFFDKFFGKNNKPKELIEGQQKPEIKKEESLKIDGQSEEIYFNPQLWQELPQEEKEKRIVAYSIEDTQEILINLILDNKEGKPIDVNLFRYGINYNYSLKELKKLILNILNSQCDPEIDIKEKIKFKNEFDEFLEENNGEYSEEGKLILQNNEEKEINTYRTFFIDKVGYNIQYYDMGEYGSINNLVNMCNNKENLKTKKEKRYIDVETEVLDLNYSNNPEKVENILNGLYNLCMIRNNLNDGKYLRTKN